MNIEVKSPDLNEFRRPLAALQQQLLTTPEDDPSKGDKKEKRTETLDIWNIILDDIGHFNDNNYLEIKEGINHSDGGREYLEIKGKKYYNYQNSSKTNSYFFERFGADANKGLYTGIQFGYLDNNYEKVGKGIYFGRFGNYIKGERKDGSLVGTGRLKLLTSDASDGGTYVGEVDGFNAHGKGTLSYANGDWKEGDRENGKFKKGKVKLTLDENWTYEGGYENGKFSGKGKMTQKVGDTIKSEYEGEFSGGVMHGKCDKYIRYGDNGKEILNFKGEMKDGNIADGEGIKVFDNDNVYEGDFIDGKTLYYYKNDANLSKENLNKIAETKLDASGKMIYKNDNNGSELYDEIKIHSGKLSSTANWWLFNDRNSTLNWSEPRGNVIYTKDIDLSKGTISYSLTSWNTRIKRSSNGMKDISTTRKFDGKDFIYDNTENGGGEIRISKTENFGENASRTVANIINFLKDNHDQYQITKFSKDGIGIEATQKKKPHTFNGDNGMGVSYGTHTVQMKGDTTVLSDVSDFGGKSAEEVANLLNMYFFNK